MRRRLIVCGVVGGWLALAPTAGHAEGEATLQPGAVLDEHRAFAWASTCENINQDAAGYDSTEFATCRATIEVAIAFCERPEVKAIPASYADLARARRQLEQGSCARSSRGVSAQSGDGFGASPGFQNALVRGIANFVVARAKAEAMAWLTTKLTNELCSDGTAQQLMSSSCAMLTSTRPADAVPIAWGTLKAAFELDLERLPETAVGTLLQEAGASDDTQTVARLGVQAAGLIRRGEDPVAVIAGLVDLYPVTKCSDDELACGLYLFGWTTRLLSLSADDYESVPRSFAPIALRLFLREGKRLGIALPPDAGAEREKLPRLLKRLFGITLPTVAEAERDKLSRLLMRLSATVVRLDLLTRAAGRPSDDAAGLAAKVGLQLTAAALNLARTSLKLRHEWNADVEGKYEVGLDLADILAAAVDAAMERQYSRVFLHVTRAVRAVADATETSYTLPTWFTRFGPFVAEVAAANTSEDVRRAIEVVAAPVGAGRAKRGSGRHTVAVTSFVGLQAGREFVDASNIEALSTMQGGLFAPIGVDVSWGLCSSHSLGVFVSVADLGALASFRRQQTVEVEADAATMQAEVESTPEVGLRQVFSPGAYVVWGIGRWAIGAGAAMTPELRRVEIDGALVTTASAIRIGAFIAIDVTLFPF